MVAWLTILAFVVVALLGWNLYRRFGTDSIDGFNERRRATSLLVGRGELIDGNRHLDVALAVTGTTLFYENSDMQASIDLEWVHEIEYDTELATGRAIDEGRVLRLRSRSQTLELVLPNDVVSRWYAILPPRRSLDTRLDATVASTA
ncbi:MAG TPA: hypothetical protein VMT00_00315 [Thermoanaerobaculia bacterium]|nr:hypothetical protein [Thermoanaerobaculia bacterium]